MSLNELFFVMVVPFFQHLLNCSSRSLAQIKAKCLLIKCDIYSLRALCLICGDKFNVFRKVWSNSLSPYEDALYVVNDAQLVENEIWWKNLEKHEICLCYPNVLLQYLLMDILNMLMRAFLHVLFLWVPYAFWTHSEWNIWAPIWILQ